MRRLFEGGIYFIGACMVNVGGGVYSRTVFNRVNTIYGRYLWGAVHI